MQGVSQDEVLFSLSALPKRKKKVKRNKGEARQRFYAPQLLNSQGIPIKSTSQERACECCSIPPSFSSRVRCIQPLFPMILNSQIQNLPISTAHPYDSQNPISFQPSGTRAAETESAQEYSERLVNMCTGRTPETKYNSRIIEIVENIKGVTLRRPGNLQGDCVR